MLDKTLAEFNHRLDKLCSGVKRMEVGHYYLLVLLTVDRVMSWLT